MAGRIDMYIDECVLNCCAMFKFNYNYCSWLHIPSIIMAMSLCTFYTPLYAIAQKLMCDAFADVILWLICWSAENEAN